MGKKVFTLLIIGFTFISGGLCEKGYECVRGKKMFNYWQQGAPVADFMANDSIICEGATVMFTDLSLNNPTSWSWTFLGGTPATSPQQNPSVVYTMAGTYSVKLVVTNASGSDSLTKTGYIVVSPPPTISVSSGKEICSGESTTLTSNGEPVGGSYLWQPGGMIDKTVSVSPTTSTVYTVTYTTDCGSVSNTIDITVSPTPILSFSSNIVVGCPPFCTQFFGKSGPAGISIASWDWSFGDGDSAFVESPAHCYSNPGKYSVVLSAISTSGCTSTYEVSDMITVYSPPVANFSYSPNPITNLQPLVSFTNESTDSYKITSWFWTFGENTDSTSTLENPAYKYSDTGTYCVSLTVEDVNGCVDTSTQCFDITSLYTFYIPNAFTPNGDGLDDVFMPEGSNIGTYEMDIYDRWGMQIFHTTNLSEGWNGGLNNGSTTCQEDAYYYVINTTDPAGLPHHYTGTVYLLK